MHKSIRSLVAPVLCCMLTMASIAACQRATAVDVSLHGVNYTGDTFSYVVKDPDKPDSPGGGGELVDPYSAGGTTCCATLPLNWRPGLKLQVDVTNWRQDDPPNGKLVETKETHLVEVPAYPDGKPGEVWVLRTANKGISVVSSDYQPNHANWPGKVKGWPVPSIEYRRERWKVIFDYEEDSVRTALSLLEALKQNPKAQANSDWELSLKHEPERIKAFSGPNDPDFILFLKKDYERHLTDRRDRMKQVAEARP